MSFTKRYWHWGWMCPAFLAVGGGLLYTVNINTSNAALIGYQGTYGLGIGLTQNVAFLSLFAGMSELGIGNAILQSGLLRYLTANGGDEEKIASVQACVFAIWELSGQLRTRVIKGYIRALNDIYIGSVLISGIIIVCGLLIRNRSLAG
ncbi:hypothetical protein BKA56DRAFT_736485 [Ilyonectria sp. MPI-CAGE-AT-0026]|nr:hypothetical protein BKA56DRAFT_736485 [Ilyonectria sp. MPI-CAGE-AT-0026]